MALPNKTGPYMLQLLDRGSPLHYRHMKKEQESIIPEPLFYKRMSSQIRSSGELRKRIQGICAVSSHTPGLLS